MNGVRLSTSVWRWHRRCELVMDYRSRITIDPARRNGKPCVRDLRVTVYDVLDYLASGMSVQQIVEEFPYLTETDVRACLAFAAGRERRLMG